MMAERYTSPKVIFNLKRDSPFSYQCKACSRCCHHKAIRISPYEILRLARFLYMSTTDFISEHTESSGTVLRTQKENDGACIFLKESGCSVHAARPLVCRVYPLGSREIPGGKQTFGLLESAPHSEGIFGTQGTVADFLTSQGLEPDYAMDKRYRAVFDRMSDCLALLDADELQKWSERQNMLENAEDGSAASPWIDIDKTVSSYCQKHGRDVPDDIEASVTLHIAAIDEWIMSLRS
jgi:uncharacterized protein